MRERTIEPWVQTWSGQALDLLDPDPQQIWLCDIATSLERTPRFNGHTTYRTWSVAHHSLLVADLVRDRVSDIFSGGLRLAALLHDAHEAYTGDLTAPMKAALQRLTGRRVIDDIAEPIQCAIHRRFNIPADLPDDWRETIHEADMVALAIESTWFMETPPRPWSNMPPVPIDAARRVAAVDRHFSSGFGFTAAVVRLIPGGASSVAVRPGHG